MQLQLRLRTRLVVESNIEYQCNNFTLALQEAYFEGEYVISLSSSDTYLESSLFCYNYHKLQDAEREQDMIQYEFMPLCLEGTLIYGMIYHHVIV